MHALSFNELSAAELSRIPLLLTQDEEVKHLRMQLGDFDRLKSDNIKLIREVRPSTCLSLW